MQLQAQRRRLCSAVRHPRVRVLQEVPARGSLVEADHVLLRVPAIHLARSCVLLGSCIGVGGFGRAREGRRARCCC